MSGFEVAVFSARRHDRRSLEQASADTGIRWRFIEFSLDTTTAGGAEGCDAVCVFVNDCVDAAVLARLAELGVRLVVLRCAGYNNVDLKAALANDICVVRVPAYSPEAVAEHALALILTLNRCTHKAYNRSREGNFSLRGLMGFNLHGRTAGLVGMGIIGTALARILIGAGMKVIGSDPKPPAAALEAGVRPVDFDTLLAESDIISLHCPLNPATYHLIDDDALARMRDGVMLINTSRGAVIDTTAVIRALKTGKLGYLGLDVYEQESELFFEDHQEDIIQDDVFQRLLTFPNVLITGHQGFFTREAVASIAEVTVDNIEAFRRSGRCQNQVLPPEQTGSA